MAQITKGESPKNMDAIMDVVAKHRDPERWFCVAVDSDGNILGHGKGNDVQTAEQNASLLAADRPYDLATMPPDPSPDCPPDCLWVPEDAIKNSRAKWYIAVPAPASVQFAPVQDEPEWSGDIAPSLEALCRRISKEAERMFDALGELPGMMLLIEAPGKGQAKVMSRPAADEDEKVERYKSMRSDFARWGVTRHAFAAESWMGTEDGAKKGLRPSEDPERREGVVIGATDGRECLAAIRDIHRPQHGKPSLGKLSEIKETQRAEGRMFALLRPRSSDELPDDEGTVFVTDVPGSSIQAIGRRDPSTGELCVGSVFKPDDRRADAPPFDEMIREAHRRGIEVVTGPEAEHLIRRIQLTDRRASNLQ